MAENVGERVFTRARYSAYDESCGQFLIWKLKYRCEPIENVFEHILIAVADTLEDEVEVWFDEVVVDIVFWNRLVTIPLERAEYIPVLAVEREAIIHEEERVVLVEFPRVHSANLNLRK